MKQAFVKTNLQITDDNIIGSINESAQVIRSVLSQSKKIGQVVDIIKKSYLSGGKLLVMGNGGSAADAQHITGELVGRFKLERRALAAVALTTDTSIITAIGNDYGFDRIFSRQVEALAAKDDVVLGISTSGNSLNVLNGLCAAKKKGATPISLIGGDGGTVEAVSDLSIVVPSNNTPKIQEAHMVIAHIICQEIEKAIISEK